MATGHTVHPSLIAGHIAVAALAVAAMRVAPPIVITLEWRQAGQPGMMLNESPRRIPMQRRANRSFAIALLD